MKKTVLILLTLVNVSVNAQDKPYASIENPQYWKNRKPNAAYWQQDVDYTIKAKLNDKTDIVDGDETLIYTNNSPDTLFKVYFHLYQNAFVKGSYLESLNLTNDFKQKFGPYEESGKGTTLSYIKAEVGGSISEAFMVETDSAFWAANPDLLNLRNQFTPQELASFHIYKKGVPNPNGTEVLSVRFDNSIMEITLPKGLLPGEKATFQLRFKTYFDELGNQRRRMKLFRDAWGNKQYDGVHWYPRICVYDRKFGWNTDQHLGKEFYGDFGRYSVELSLPNNYVLDATGVLQNSEEVLPATLRAKLDISNFKDKPLDSAPSEITKADGTYKTWKFISINTHDFAWVADPTFRIGESIVTLGNGEKVSCISLAQEPHAARWQDAAKFTSRVIETYSKDIGNYVYPKMIVADARDGMEYPMLTLDGGLSPGYYGLFAHEVGHNWFFGMVGNNETYRACLDEGFTQFLTNWCMTRIFGEVKPTDKNPHPIARMDQTVYYGYLRDAIKGEDMTLNTHSDDFNGALNHGGGYGHVYYKTATMLYNLQYVLGDTLFLAAMQHYFDQWKMAHPYIEDFRSSIINFTHVDLNWFFDQWFETTKSIDYSILNHESKNHKELPGFTEHKITFYRSGDMQMPIDFTVYGKDSGQRFNYHIPNTYFVKELEPKTKVLKTWKGWGILNRKYDAVIVLPSNIDVKKVMIDPTYRLADVYQPDNATKGNSYFVFDKGRKLPVDRRFYIWEWRPDLWYNSIDGVKAGLHLEGNYMNYRDVLRTSVWYNTGTPDKITVTDRRLIDYTFFYKTGLGGSNSLYMDFRELDGLSYVKVGYSTEVGKAMLDISIKSMERAYKRDIDYLLYPEWNAGMHNTYLNFLLTRQYSHNKSSGEIRESFSIAGSGVENSYSYAKLQLSWVNHQAIGKTELHSRFIVSMIKGSNVAPESQIYLSGANPEEMMENKFIRSRAFIPTDWLNLGANYNHFQAGGGLNIRGYAGYLVPRDASGSQVYLYKGNTGAAVNLEYDFDGLISFKPRKVYEYIHFDSYLFADGGILEGNFKAGDYGITKDATVNTGFMVSAGTGFAMTIKKWGNIDKAKPLTIRLDLPLLLTNSPYIDGQYFRMRWMVGISRSF